MVGSLFQPQFAQPHPKAVRIANHHHLKSNSKIRLFLLFNKGYTINNLMVKHKSAESKAQTVTRYKKINKLSSKAQFQLLHGKYDRRVMR
jgi:hypothetical protein